MSRGSGGPRCPGPLVLEPSAPPSVPRTRSLRDRPLALAAAPAPRGRPTRAARAPVRGRVRGSREVPVHFRLEPGAREPGPATRSPAWDSARGAEGEGFEPSIRLTTDNGFRAPARMARTGDRKHLRDTPCDSRPQQSDSPHPLVPATIRRSPPTSAGLRRKRCEPRPPLRQLRARRPSE